MNNRESKIKQLDSFFSGKKLDTRTVEPIFIIRTTRNGKLVEPIGMTEKDFDIYLDGLKTKYRRIVVFNTEMQD